MKPNGLLSLPESSSCSAAPHGGSTSIRKRRRRFRARPKSWPSVGSDSGSIRIAKAGADPVVLKNMAGSWPSPTLSHARRPGCRQPLVTTSAALTADRLIDEHPASLERIRPRQSRLEVDVTVKGGNRG